MGYSFTLTPKDIYGVEEPEIPKGYKVVGFRPPQMDEIYRSKVDCTAEVADHVDASSLRSNRNPRLILEKLPEKRLLVLETCFRCGYFDSGHTHCNATGNAVPSLYSIPEWCPLPKAP